MGDEGVMSRDLNDPQLLGEALLKLREDNPDYGICVCADSLYEQMRRDGYYHHEPNGYERRNGNSSPETNGAPAGRRVDFPPASHEAGGST